jgi:hypothetical protein
MGSRKPACKLIGTDGNVFSIIGLVRRALVADGQEDRAREFVERAFQSRSMTRFWRYVWSTSMSCKAPCPSTLTKT